MFKVHHIDIWVRKLDESINFYNALGFQRIKEIDNQSENKKIIIMKLNDIILELKYHYSNSCSHNEVECKDNKIFGLSVKNINEAKKYLKDNNLTDEEINIKQGVLGNRYFFIHDPNNILLEFIEEDEI